MTSPKSKEVEVLGAERRLRWSAAEKLGMVRETYEAGMTVSLVARKHGINPNQLFHWRTLEFGAHHPQRRNGERAGTKRALAQFVLWSRA
jgi:transposase-like protein